MKRLVMAVSLSAILLGTAAAVPPEAAKDSPSPVAKPLFRFQAIDGDPEREEAKNLMFQVARLDVKGPVAFLRLGDFVPGTTWKLSKFEYKQRGEVEASELTLVNAGTQETLTLVIGAKGP